MRRAAGCGRGVLVLSLTGFLGSLSYSIVKPGLAYQARYGFNALAVHVSMIAVGFMLARGLAAFIAGVVSDRGVVGRGLMVTIGLAGLAVVMASYSLAGGVYELITLSLLHGVFSGMTWPSVHALVSSYSPAGSRNYCMGVYFAAAGLGSSVGYLVYGLTGLDPARLLVLGSLVQAAAWPLVAFLGGGLTSSRTQASKTPGVLAKPLLVSLSNGLVVGLSSEILYLTLWEVQGLSPGYLGLVLSIASLSSITLTPLAGRLADKLGEERVILYMMVVASSSLALIPLRMGWATVFVVTALLTSSSSITSLSRSYAGGVSSLVGTSIGLVNAVSNLGSVASPLYAGLVYDSFKARVPVAGLEYDLSAGGYFVTSLVSAVLTLLLARGVVGRARG